MSKPKDSTAKSEPKFERLGALGRSLATTGLFLLGLCLLIAAILLGLQGDSVRDVSLSIVIGIAGGIIAWGAARSLGLLDGRRRIGLLATILFAFGAALATHYLLLTTGSPQFGWAGCWTALAACFFGGWAGCALEDGNKASRFEKTYRWVFLGLIIIGIDAWAAERILPRRDKVGQFAGDSRSPKHTRGWSEANLRFNANNTVRNINNGEAMGHSGEDWMIRTNLIPAGPERVLPHRILVTGDSFVWGDGYPNINVIWWRQLERELRRRGYLGVEVLGAGACGASTGDQMDRMDAYMETYQPDAVIWGFCHNDPDEGLVAYHNNNESAIVESDSWMIRLKNLIQNRVFPNIAWELRQKRYARVTSQTNDWFTYRDWTMGAYDPEGANWKAYEWRLGQLGKTMKSATEAGIPSLLLVFGGAPAEEISTRNVRPKLQAVLEPALDAAGIPWVDSQPLITGRAGIETTTLPQYNVNPANGHTGLAGTSCWAKTAADYLEENFPDVLGNKTSPSDRKMQWIVDDWLPIDMTVFRHLGSSQIELRIDGRPDLIPTVPFGKKHLRLHLTDSTALSEIRLQNVWLERADVYVRAQIPVDEIHNDDSVFLDAYRWQKLPLTKGKAFAYSLESYQYASYVTEVAIVPDFTYEFETPPKEQWSWNTPFNRLRVTFQSAEQGWYAPLVEGKAPQSASVE